MSACTAKLRHTQIVEPHFALRATRGTPLRSGSCRSEVVWITIVSSKLDWCYTNDQFTTKGRSRNPHLPALTSPTFRMPTYSVSAWGDVLLASLQGLWTSFIDFVPRLLGALIVFVVGWIIAAALGNVARRIIDFLQIDRLIEKLNIHKVFERADVDLSIARLIGWLVKWFLIIAFLIAAADILGWDQVTSFLKDVALYIPQVFVAVVILVAGIVAADFTYKVVSKAVKSAGLVSSGFVSGVAKWAVLIFSVLVALDQLDIGRTLLNTLVQGFVATLAIAAGLAFGLGGKDHAGRFLDRIRKDISG